MARRRRRGGTPRCQHCQRPVRFFSHDGRWRPFDVTPLTGHEGIRDDAMPIFGNQAWDYYELLIELVEHQHRDDADQEVLDLPWHRPHRCPQQAAARTQDDQRAANV